MQAIIIIIIASYPSIQLILPLLLIAPCIKMLLAFLVFLFSKVSRETFLQMFLLKNRATKTWYTSQLSLATRLLRDPGRCSEPHAPAPALPTAVHCLFRGRNQVSAPSAPLAHPSPSRHVRRRKLPSPPACRLQQ